ncbi:DUF502 domain-containing protein [Clostridium sp. DL1XJH146]
MIKHIKNNFLTGLILLLPIFLTLWILTSIFNTLDAILGTLVTRLLGFKIPGLGLILVIALILVVGLIANNVLGKKITEMVERMFEKVPIIKAIYLPIRDILKNFSNKKSNNFKKAVFVEFPKENILSIGFITKEDITFEGELKTAIFIPTTPNPTNGFLVYLKKGDYRELDIPVDVALKSIISLGSFSPDIMNSCGKKDINTDR